MTNLPGFRRIRRPKSRELFWRTFSRTAPNSSANLRLAIAPKGSGWRFAMIAAPRHRASKRLSEPRKRRTILSGQALSHHHCRQANRAGGTKRWPNESTRPNAAPILARQHAGRRSDLGKPPIGANGELWAWIGKYDSFLGYMAWVIEALETRKNGFEPL